MRPMMPTLQMPRTARQARRRRGIGLSAHRRRQDTPQSSRVSSNERGRDAGLIASRVFVARLEGLFGRLSARCSRGPPAPRI